MNAPKADSHSHHEPVQLHWRDDNHLRINDVDFLLSFDSETLRTEMSLNEGFLLGKPRHMVERVVALGAQHTFANILEMGILKGGSVVLYDQLFSPRKIVAIDHSPEPVKPLATYISRRHKRDVVKPFYGVNQADRTVMEAILAREFPGRDLNLIVDDASHFYAETRDAFNISFPYLAPGGHYVIEDWAWAHWAGDTWQREQVAALAGKPALSNLIVEILMLAASRPDFIKDIVIDHNMAIICKGVRGPAPGNFDIGEHYLLRGKKFGAWL